MNKIITLPERIISRIAAGEVIERPVYAVKELIENSLDAGSDSIRIQIEEAGLKKIVVSDNGEGMSEEDLLQSFKPHTTSKVTEETLIGIKTLGFRGEALASIAAISTLTLQSRTKETPAGISIKIQNGEIVDKSPMGMPVGTAITIQNLFSTVPARKKFLKTQRTEFRHIVELISSYALAYPHIRFTLIHNKKIILDLSKNMTLPNRIEKILGASLLTQLLPITAEPSYVQIQGFIARPQISVSTQSKQYIFVNKRLVSDRLISNAVKEIYGHLLEATRFPVFILFLDLPHEAVDVNVHPRKEQVIYMNTRSVYDAVKDAISKTLSKNNLTFSQDFMPEYSPRAGTTSLYAAQVLKEEITPWNVKDALSVLDSSDIIQIHNTYVMAQTKRGALLLDQHAAHERILYEQFKKEFHLKKKKVMKLEEPLFIEVSTADVEVLHEHLETLQTFGFTIKQEKNHTFYITHVPELFKDRDISQLIHEMVEELANDKEFSNLDHLTDLMLSFLACRSAIKAGEKLTQQEARKLIQKLQKTPDNTTCPHGRPTQIEVDLKNLHRMFKRS
jgi:DNA mismatch repair protein MutL